jgi:small-conductance mechanosensitive channel
MSFFDNIRTVLSLVQFNGEHVVFGNSIDAYIHALSTFVVVAVCLALVEYVSVSWIGHIAERTATRLDDAFHSFMRGISPPVYLVASFWYAIVQLDLHPYLSKAFHALIIVWVVSQGVRVVGILVHDVIFERFTTDKDETTRSALNLVANLSRGVMWLVGILLLLANLGVNVTSLVAGAGIAGIAVAFALQGILTDLFSSFSIYFDKPFGVGDFVVIGDTMGTVRHIGIKSTRIRALSGEEISLSNQDLTKAKICNVSRMEERRVVIRVGIVHETPIDKCRAIPDMLKDIITGQTEVRFDRAHLYSVGDSALQFEVVYFVLTPDYLRFMDVQQEIGLQMIEQFRQEGIAFAYPTQTIYTSESASL